MFGRWRPREDGHVQKMKAIAEVQFLGEVRWDWMWTVGSRRTGGMERRGSSNLSGIWIKIVPLTSVGQVGPGNGVPGDVLRAEYHPYSKASGPGERAPFSPILVEWGTTAQDSQNAGWGTGSILLSAAGRGAAHRTWPIIAAEKIREVFLEFAPDEVTPKPLRASLRVPASTVIARLLLKCNHMSNGPVRTTKFSVIYNYIYYL